MDSEILVGGEQRKRKRVDESELLVLKRARPDHHSSVPRQLCFDPIPAASASPPVTVCCPSTCSLHLINISPNIMYDYR